MDTNYIRVNIPNAISATVMVFAVTAAVGFFSKLIKSARA